MGLTFFLYEAKLEGQLTARAESLELISIGGSEAQQSEQETPLPTLDPETHTVPSNSEEPLVRGQRNKMESVQLQTMSKRNWLNVILLGFGFMFLFTAFQTSAFVQVTYVVPPWGDDTNIYVDLQTITINSFLAPGCRNVTNGTSTYIDVRHTHTFL